MVVDAKIDTTSLALKLACLNKRQSTKRFLLALALLRTACWIKLKKSQPKILRVSKFPRSTKDNVKLPRHKVEQQIAKKNIPKTSRDPALVPFASEGGGGPLGCNARRSLHASQTALVATSSPQGKW